MVRVRVRAMSRWDNRRHWPAGESARDVKVAAMAVGASRVDGQLIQRQVTSVLLRARRVVLVSHQRHALEFFSSDRDADGDDVEGMSWGPCGQPRCRGTTKFIMIPWR